MLTQITLDAATNAKALKSDNASLKIELKSDINELKSDDALLKADVEKNAKEFKSDMETAIKASRDEIMGCIGAFETRIENVEKNDGAVSNMVQVVTTKLSAIFEKLNEVDVKVSKNRENITEL